MIQTNEQTLDGMFQQSQTFVISEDQDHFISSGQLMKQH